MSSPLSATFTKMPVPCLTQLREYGFSSEEQFLTRYPGGRCDQYQLNRREALIRYYLFGMCAVFALALYDRTRWQIVGVFDRRERRVPRHLACRRANGWYSDARGPGLTEAILLAPYRSRPNVHLEIRDMATVDVKAIFLRHPYHNHQARSVHLDALIPGLPNPG